MHSVKVKFVGTLHCALENGSDMLTSVRRYDTIALGLLKKEEERRMPNAIFFFYFARCVRKLALYSDVIHSFYCKSAIEHDGGVSTVVIKMRDSVPNARYSSVCNVFRQWRIWVIPTYRV